MSFALSQDFQVVGPRPRWLNKKVCRKDTLDTERAAELSPGAAVISFSAAGGFNNYVFLFA